VTGGFGSSGGHRADGLRSEKHRDRRDFGDVGGKVATSDEDDDRHRASRGSRQSHKTSGSQQGDSDYGLGIPCIAALCVIWWLWCWTSDR